jgi:TonB family protein
VATRSFTMRTMKRRRHLRQTIRTMLYLDFNGSSGAMVLDLSESGVAVLSAVPLRAQERVTCHIELMHRHIEMEGVITCADATGRAGIEFTSMAECDRRVLKDWLFMNALSGGVPQFGEPGTQSENAPESPDPSAGSVSDVERPVEKQKLPPAVMDALSFFRDETAPQPAAANELSIADLPVQTDAALEAIARHAREITAADGSAIALSHENEIVCRARAGEIAPDLGARLDSPTSFSGQCVRSNSTLVCDNSEADPRVDAEVCRQLGIRSIIASPVRQSGSAVGVIEIFSSLPRAFSAAHVALIERHAELAANIAFRNTPPMIAGPAATVLPAPPLGQPPAPAVASVPVSAETPPSPGVASVPVSAEMPPSLGVASVPVSAETPASPAVASVPVSAETPPSPAAPEPKPVVTAEPKPAPAAKAVPRPETPTTPTAHRTATTAATKNARVPTAAPAPPIAPAGRVTSATPPAPRRSAVVHAEEVVAVLRPHVGAEMPAPRLVPERASVPAPTEPLSRRQLLLPAVVLILILIAAGIGLWKRRSPSPVQSNSAPTATQSSGTAATPDATPAAPSAPLAASAVATANPPGAAPVLTEGKPTTGNATDQAVAPKTKPSALHLAPSSETASPSNPVPDVAPPQISAENSHNMAASLGQVLAPPLAVSVAGVPSPARVSQGAKQGKLLFKAQPRYPEQARRAGVEGQVSLSLDVGADGKVHDVHLRSGHPMLVPAAIEAVRRWRYEPSLLNGVPTPVTAEVVVTFKGSQH